LMLTRAVRRQPARKASIIHNPRRSWQFNWVKRLVAIDPERSLGKRGRGHGARGEEGATRFHAVNSRLPIRLSTNHPFIDGVIDRRPRAEVYRLGKFFRRGLKRWFWQQHDRIRQRTRAPETACVSSVRPLHCSKGKTLLQSFWRPCHGPVGK